jgi:soluble lytic murein transglycosylase-like protein
MNRAALILGVALASGIGVLLYFIAARRAAGASTSDALEEITVDAKHIATGEALWNPPPQYASAITTAENYYGLPPNLLARQLYQESGYRPEVIDGRVKSSAGAEGIAQIIREYHPGVDPLDPIASIYYAAKYDRQLFDKFGNWRDALAAYNFGPANVASGAAWPSETVAYVEKITADVNV